VKPEHRRPFLPDALLAELAARAVPVDQVPGLRVAPGLREEFPTYETVDALSVVVEAYRAVRGEFAELLDQRRVDRAFVDAQVLAGRDPIGLRDDRGRVVVGPTGEPPPDVRVEVPAFLRGEQVTLFGPPESARMCVHAMNALHRRRPDEPPIVAELVAASGQVPRWGADDEDSRTPILPALLRAGANLDRCFDGTLTAGDLRLADQGRSLPIKRVPGLALPDGWHLLDGEPLPLHLTDLVLHVWHQRRRPEALVLYFPKLETEDEARYLRRLVEATARACAARDPASQADQVKFMVVFESPRAIFRIREIAAALGPHFVGGSLGWHDFLASTARLFRHDPRYRIPVKADPNIVIDRIQASHRRLVEALDPVGALPIGGMYGVLYEEGNAASFQASMAGYVRDVVTQLRRGLRGFWVAHPDFVRLGLALVEAWRRRERDPADRSLDQLLDALIPDPVEREGLARFVATPDPPVLDPADPRYPRAVLAADLGRSSVIANDDPEEVRYNVFQALQYLAAWLTGNGCVALPATIRTARGEPVAVRVMDDLATTERSRWEVWAEVHHGRVPVAAFDALLEAELAYLRAGEDAGGRRIQVRWEGEAARWYPIAGRLLRALVTTADPPEWVSEWLLPFTFPGVRDAPDPWSAARGLGAAIPT
jgi:malate synthase